MGMNLGERSLLLNPNQESALAPNANPPWKPTIAHSKTHLGRDFQHFPISHAPGCGIDTAAVPFSISPSDRDVRSILCQHKSPSTLGIAS